MSDRLTPGLVRVAAPAALAALTCAGAIRTDRPLVVVLGLSVVVAAASGLLAWRKVEGPRLLAGLAIPAAGVVIACYGDPRNVGWFGLCVVVGWVALATPPSMAVSAGVAVVTVLAFQLATVSPEPGWVSWIAGTALTAGAFVFVRRQRELVVCLQSAQAELADNARADERHEIAREMHDLVGHGLTVALLHLGSARLALDEDVATARTSLAEAERAARDSLDDVRAAVGLMRAATPVAPRPVPAATDIADLVDSYRNAGAGVELDLCGDLAALTANRSLAAFRIVQESLTNAVRHGDGSPISVQVDVADGRTRITVRSGGNPGQAFAAGTGVVAMRERARALGGRLAAGHHEDGWLVEAVIPG